MKQFIAITSAAILGGAISLGGYHYLVEEQNTTPISVQDSLSTQVVHTNFKSGANFEFNENSFADAAEKTVNSVVHVKNVSIARGSTSIFDLIYGREDQGRMQVGTGSGVIITPDGYIITNNHVIANASSLEVTLNNNKTYQAKLIGTDVNSDIALLKIDAEDKLPYLTFADSDNTKVGEWVLAVGNPFNLNSTVTAGIISAKARNISGDRDGKVDSYIQTDAAVNMGNSGGALVNLNGDLIGINTAITSNTGTYVGYSFAVPSNIAKKVVEDLIEFGNVQKGVLGVRGTDLNSEVAEKLNLNDTEGFYVANVEENSGADKAGIKKGDIIKKLDGVKINSFSNLSGFIASKRPNDTVQALIERDGEEITLSVTLHKNDTFVVRGLGLELKDLTQTDKKHYKVSNGVKITNASQYYKMNDIDMVGKVLVSINGNPIRSVDDLSNMVSQLSSNNRNSLELINQNGERERFIF